MKSSYEMAQSVLKKSGKIRKRLNAVKTVCGGVCGAAVVTAAIMLGINILSPRGVSLLNSNDSSQSISQGQNTTDTPSATAKTPEEIAALLNEKVLPELEKKERHFELLSRYFYGVWTADGNYGDEGEYLRIQPYGSCDIGGINQIGESDGVAYLAGINSGMSYYVIAETDNPSVLYYVQDYARGERGYYVHIKTGDACTDTSQVMSIVRMYELEEQKGIDVSLFLNINYTDDDGGWIHDSGYAMAADYNIYLERESDTELVLRTQLREDVEDLGDSDLYNQSVSNARVRDVRYCITKTADGWEQNILSISDDTTTESIIKTDGLPDITICFPVDPSAALITALTYGDGGYVGHTGVDISAPKGTPVYAAVGGTIKRSDWYYGYGQCVEIEDSNGFTWVYGHLDEIMVASGDEISAGAQIGTVGSSGQATDFMLHLELRKGSTVYSPLAYLGDYSISENTQSG